MTVGAGVRIDERAGGAVAFVTFDNAAKLNTLTSVLMQELVAQVSALAARDDLRALVLTGAGERAFIGGADIAEMAALDKTTARDFITRVHRTCDVLRRFPVPVIARIDGYALGAGLEVAVSCDFRVATTRSKFGMPEVKVGLPSVVEAALIPRLIGAGRANELLMLGETIDAATALSWGLIDRAADADALDTELHKLVTALLAAGPQAVRRQKALMREWENLPADHAIEAGIDAFARTFESDEPTRLLSAFVKRKRT
jgi:enoyl-CoA hydratase/carnithine racemase